MKLNVTKEVAALKRLTMHDLRAKYAEVFGDATPSGNRAWLVKRVIWRLQALAKGDLSERARRRAAELADDAELRVIPPVPPRPAKPTAKPAPTPEPVEPAPGAARVKAGGPMPGTVLTRTYKGERLEVRVLAGGFEFEGAVYRSLSAVAKAITGAHWNGRLFFGITRQGGQP